MSQLFQNMIDMPATMPPVPDSNLHPIYLIDAINFGNSSPFPPLNSHGRAPFLLYCTTKTLTRPEL